ncbi:hypothetical protein [Halosegnis sp.]|uniref:hypothetical protein n=1 Tax=Halosegnis sp. TaxID=2864959 RepID=UPI0035D4D899
MTGDGEPTVTDAGSDRDGGQLASLRARLSVPLSAWAFLLALTSAAGGSLLAGLVPFIPATVATLVGIFAAGIFVGLLRATRSYLEVAAAGSGIAALAVGSRYLLVSVLGDIGVPIALIGAGAGLLAGVLGHYLGRDLRYGLTREL